MGWVRVYKYKCRPAATTLGAAVVSFLAYWCGGLFLVLFLACVWGVFRRQSKLLSPQFCMVPGSLLRVCPYFRLCLALYCFFVPPFWLVVLEGCSCARRFLRYSISKLSRWVRIGFYRDYGIGASYGRRSFQSPNGPKTFRCGLIKISSCNCRFLCCARAHVVQVGNPHQVNMAFPMLSPVNVLIVVYFAFSWGHIVANSILSSG